MPRVYDKDPYEILGLPFNATASQVKQAYHRLARQYHPDLNKDARASERMKDINWKPDCWAIQPDARHSNPTRGSGSVPLAHQDNTVLQIAGATWVKSVIPRVNSSRAVLFPITSAGTWASVCFRVDRSSMLP